MKSFQVRDGKVMVDGVVYSQNPTDVNIMGKMGKILSINIPNRGQFFPISGVFDDGTAPIVQDEPVSKKKVAKTELKESSGVAVDQSGKLVKKSRSKKK